MKKFILIFVIACSMMASVTTANAQKSGYIRIDEVVSLMPDIRAKMDTFVTRFLRDSVAPQFNYLQSEYSRKLIQLGDTVHNTLAVRNTILGEMNDIKSQLDNADNIVEQVRQQKQNEFLEPFYVKVNEAVNAVAKEKGYTYVYSKDALIVAPPADDLLPLVAAKLNLKVPAQSATPPKPAGK